MAPVTTVAFTQALLNNIEIPGLEINFLFRNVRDDVLDETHETQEPFLYGSLSQDEIYLKPAADADNNAPGTAVSAKVEAPADEIAWSYLQHSAEPATLQSFAEQFPSSMHVAEARQRIASLDVPQVTTDAGPSAPLQPDEISWSFLSDEHEPGFATPVLGKVPYQPLFGRRPSSHREPREAWVAVGPWERRRKSFGQSSEGAGCRTSPWKGQGHRTSLSSNDPRS